MSAELRQLPVSISIWNRLRIELAEAYGLADDDDALPDTLDGEADLGDQIATLISDALEKEMFAEAIDKRISELRGRKDRLNKAAKAIRAAVADAAAEAAIKKLVRPEFTLSFGVLKPSLAGDASADDLPDDLVHVKREVDRRAIKAAIEAGRPVPGFHLSNGRPTVAVRVK